MKDLVVKPSITIFKALSAMNDVGEKCLIVVDDTNALLGTLSDGDLRKAILKGTNVNNSVVDIYNKRPFFFYGRRVFKERSKKSIFEEQVQYYSYR